MAGDDRRVSLRFSELNNDRVGELSVTAIPGAITADRHDRAIWSRHVFPLVAEQIPGLVKLVLRATDDCQPAEAFAFADGAVHQIVFETDRYALALVDMYQDFGTRAGVGFVTEVWASQSRGGADILGPSFDTDPAGWLRHKAPDDWTKDQQAQTRAKQRWLKAARSKPDVRATCSAADVRTAWHVLLDRGAAVPREPADKTDFDAFKAVTGYALPRELKALASLSNGADLPGHRYGRLLTVAEIARTWLSWKSIFDDWRLEELSEGRVNADPRVLEAYVIPAWVPFIDENGNMIGFDRQPGPGGEIGQIVSYGREVESTRVVAANLAALLDDL